MLKPTPHVTLGWKAVERILNRLIDGANASRPVIGDGLTFMETPNGVIVSLIRAKNTSSGQPQQPPQPSQFWITVPLEITLEGQQTVTTGGLIIAPGGVTGTFSFNQDGTFSFDPTGTVKGGGGSPDTSNPNNYFPFALPSGGYTITFLNNVFQPIGTDGSISVSGGSVSNITSTTVVNLEGGIDTTGWSWAKIDAFNHWLNINGYAVTGGFITSFNWELTMKLSPLTPIDAEFGRFFFSPPDPPSGAVYAVIGEPGNNIFGSRAINLGQFTINNSSELGTAGGTI